MTVTNSESNSENKPQKQTNNPLHGITLEELLVRLVVHLGWEELGSLIKINCFNDNPSIKSSLKFLRKTPWARKKVEDLYLYYDKFNWEKDSI